MRTPFFALALSLSLTVVPAGAQDTAQEAPAPQPFALCGWQNEQITLPDAAPDGPFAGHWRAPSAVRLIRTKRHNAPGVRYCGGVAVGDHWVLTSARCVAHKSWPQLDVRTGTTDMTSFGRGAVRRAVAALCPGPDAPEGDIALVRLDADLPPEVPRAALASGDETATRALAASWPLAGGRNAGRIYVVDMVVTGRDADSDRLIARPIDRRARIPCFDEQGSALSIQDGNRVLGILSTVEGPGRTLRAKCEGAQASLITPVADWADWITDTMAACDADPALCAAATPDG